MVEKKTALVLTRDCDKYNERISFVLISDTLNSIFISKNFSFLINRNHILNKNAFLAIRVHNLKQQY